MDHDTSLKILIVEDDSDTRLNLRDILELDGHEIQEAATIAEALDRDDWSTYATILLDRKLPDGTAAELLPQLKKLCPSAEIIIITGNADLDGAILALRHGASDYLLKPINADQLRARLARIGEHRRLKKASCEAERFARSVLDSLSANIAVLDHGGTIIAVNEAWRNFAKSNGAGRANVAEGANYLRACTRLKASDADDGRAFAYGIHLVLDGKRDSFEMEYPCHSPEKHRWFLGRVTPFQGEEPRRVVIAHIDITKRKEAEERALHAERLAAIGQMVTGLAHESRNALQRGQACLEMLSLEVPNQPRAKDLIGRLQKAQDDLARLYEDVRDYASPVKLRLSSCNIADVWRTSWSDLEHLWKCRDAVLSDDFDGAELIVQIDPFRMRQVFKNLMENALAATADPVRIDIRCTCEQSSTVPMLHISVRDSGPGFTAEQRQKIFGAFYTTKAKGTGLGLAICRGIMEAHGGRIDLGLEPGAGAEFILSLPRDQS